MRRLLTIGIVLLAAFAATACQREPTTAELELVGEVRALRLQLRDRAQEAPASPPHRESVEAAMAPLQGALAALSDAQRDLSAQQAALAAELQRWTQLVAVAVQQQGSTETQTLTQRLTQLEQQIQAQDTRHREVEALLQKALDSTADQLEDFLRRLGRREPAPQRGDESEPTSSEPAPADPGGGKTPVEERRGATPWIWWGLAGASIFAGWVVLRRARKGAPWPLPSEMRRAVEHTTPHEDAEPQAPTQHEVEELWAAAALLGEAIGRLKQTGAAASSDPAPTGAAASHSAGEQLPPPEDLLVFDQEPDDHPQEPTPPPPGSVPRRAAPYRSSPGHDRAAPKAVVCRLRANDANEAADRVRQLLRDDPRVLIAPAPEIAPSGQDLTVTFALLPGLPPGERSRLEQLLRDAVA